LTLTKNRETDEKKMTIVFVVIPDASFEDEAGRAGMEKLAFVQSKHIPATYA